MGDHRGKSKGEWNVGVETIPSKRRRETGGTSIAGVSRCSSADGESSCRSCMFGEERGSDDE